MKPLHIYICIALLAATAALAGCASDEMASRSTAEEKTPLRIASASYEAFGGETRAADGKSAWTGDGTETFGVKVQCSDGTVNHGQYLIKDANGTVEAVEYMDAYITSSGEYTVSAWYPYEAMPIDIITKLPDTTTINVADQANSDKLTAKDILYSPKTSYQTATVSPTISFSHAMAKLRVRLSTNTGGETSTTILTGATISNCNVEGKLNSDISQVAANGTTGTITPCVSETDANGNATAYEALLPCGLIPANATVTLTISVDGAEQQKTYNIAPTGDKSLKPGDIFTIEASPE